MSLTGISEERVHPHLYPSQQLQQQQHSACYPLNGRLLCLQCHQRRLSPPTTTTVTTTAGSSSSDSSSCTSGTSWAGFHDNDVTWPPVGVTYSGGQSSLFVDVTIDGDASSCTTSDDVTISDDVSSNPGSDVTECPQPASNEQAQPADGNSAWSVDSGHCSGASDDTVTSSDTETLDAGSEEDDDDDNDDGGGDTGDGESPVTSDTLGRHSNATVISCDSLSILDLLADSSRVTDL